MENKKDGTSNLKHTPGPWHFTINEVGYCEIRQNNIVSVAIFKDRPESRRSSLKGFQHKTNNASSLSNTLFTQRTH